MWKDFFYYSRREKQGIIILILLIFIVIGINIFLSVCKQETSIVEDEEFEKEYAEFIASIKEIKKEREEEYLSNQRKWKKNNNEYQDRVLFSFNPNEADSITFLKLGLPKWIAANILKYRSKGGKFYKPEDFKKIYGITEDKYKELYSYIQIPQTTTISKDTVRLLTSTINKDTLKAFKYTTGTRIHINKADTTELKKIPGIGSYIARKIIHYRSQLGGFYTINQLKEIDIDAAKLEEWFIITDNETERINLNTASIERLRNHPYLNFYQAKVIVEYRKKKGKLKGLPQLALYEEFTEEDFNRISHYVCFE